MKQKSVWLGLGIGFSMLVSNCKSAHYIEAEKFQRNFYENTEREYSQTFEPDVDYEIGDNGLILQGPQLQNVLLSIDQCKKFTQLKCEPEVKKEASLKNKYDFLGSYYILQNFDTVCGSNITDRHKKLMGQYWPTLQQQTKSCAELFAKSEKAQAEKNKREETARNEEREEKRKNRNARVSKMLKIYPGNDVSQAFSGLIAIGVSKDTLANPDNLAALIFFARTQGHRKFVDAMKALISGRVIVTDQLDKLEVYQLKQLAVQMNNVMAADAIFVHICQTLSRSLENAN